MQHEVDKSLAVFPVLQHQQQQYQPHDTPQVPGGGQAAPCVRPSTSGSAGGASHGGMQRGNTSPQRPSPNLRANTSSTQPAQSSPLQQSQVTRPRAASTSQQGNPAAAVIQQLTRSGTQNTSQLATPQTPTQTKAAIAQATTPSGGLLPALPPSPPLTRSATRSRSSVITATQNQQYVDYLLQNGGLPKPISITFSPQKDPHEIAYTTNNGTEVPEVSYAPVDDLSGDGKSLQTIFAPLHYSLDAYTQILTNGGSVAVGTGYRSVARRLLERVEALFARDIGLPWGETLEWLRGKRRRERLPVLPVLPVRGLLKKGSSGVDEGETPTVLGNNQIPEEPRYPPPPPPIALPQPPADGQGVHQMLQEGEKIRTKTKVEEWLDETETVLSTTINNNASGPVLNSGSTSNGKANDIAGIFYVTLANQFNLPPQNSQALTIPQDAASTASQEEEEEKLVSGIVMDLLNESPLQKELYATYLADNALLERTMLALRRLYTSFPTHTITRSIAALYLLLHPDLHPVLEAISRITKGELDLLNSGRFDGFLDEKDIIPADEEKELEALEVLDGNIFRTMEKLEDEIEALHVRAEEVRRKLRVRKEAIARKLVLAGKDKDNSNGGVAISGGGGSMEQFGGVLSRQNTAASAALVKHVQLPPPPPKSDYFEGLDRESTLNPIMPDDSASNYGSRHRRRTTRKAASSALAGEEGELARRGSTASGAGVGPTGAGSAAQHLMKKQLEREKEKRDKERNREKFEKERERREKEERRKAKLANAAANIGFHHRGSVGDGSGSGLPQPPYLSPPELGLDKDKLLPGSPLVPKRKKSKEEHKDKRDRHRSPERPLTSGKKGLENPPSREFDMTGGGTTMVATSPPTLVEDMLASAAASKDRASKEKDSKKKEKSKEDKEKDKNKKDIDDEQPLPTDEQKEVHEKRRFSIMKSLKFGRSDHENATGEGGSNDTARPGTSGSIRPLTAQSVNTALTTATNATGTAMGPTDIPSSSSGKHRKERRHHTHHKVIPEADDEDEDGDEKIMRQHHTTRRRPSRRATGSTNAANATTMPRGAMEVLSEPEDLFGREDRPSYNITGVFSDDEGAGAGVFNGMSGANGLKQQLISRKGLRRSSESKKVLTEGVDKDQKEKDKEKARREDRRERKRIERQEEQETLKEQERLRASLGMSHASSGAPIPMSMFPSLTSSPPPSAPSSHPGDILPSSVALPSHTPRLSYIEDPAAASDNNYNYDKEKEKSSKRDRKGKEKKPEYKPSFSSSGGGGSGQGGVGGGGGVSLLGLEASGGDGLLTSSFAGGVKEKEGGFDAEVMTLGEGTTMVGDATMPGEIGRSRTPRQTGLGIGPSPGPGDRLSTDFLDADLD